MEENEENGNRDNNINSKNENINNNNRYNNRNGAGIIKNVNIVSLNVNVQQHKKIIFSEYSPITISFILFLIINLSIEIYSYWFPIDKSYYVFQFYSIISKKQYYRLITKYFIHFSFMHLFLELIAFFFLCKYYENIFGTLLTINLIIISMIGVSILNILFLELLSDFFKIFRLFNAVNLDYQGGFTPILFTFYTYYFLYSKNKRERIHFFTIFNLKARHSSFIILFLLYFFTPNRNFIGNLVGILSGYIIKLYPKYILPKIKWIKDIEDTLKLNKIKYLYRFINIEDEDMKNILNEFDDNYMEEIEKGIEKNKTQINFNKLESNYYNNEIEREENEGDSDSDSSTAKNNRVKQ